MNWTELINDEIETTYQITNNLLDLVDDDKLDWAPAAENNWMTTGQLLKHITTSCGACFKGFVTGDWGLPEGVDINNLPLDEMLPPAEKMSTIGSVKEAIELLEEDKKVALDILGKCSEDTLANKTATAPWDPVEKILGYQLFQMVGHLASHKAQLFYYLKLQGKSVNTQTLWGM